MDEQRKEAVGRLKTASPLEATQILQQMELYDAKSSQEVIDEVYMQFKSGENMKDECLSRSLCLWLTAFWRLRQEGAPRVKRG